MTASDPRARVGQSIQEAIANLGQALIELDRVPGPDRTTVGFVAHAMNNYLTVTDATLGLLQDALREHPDRDVASWLEGLRHLGDMMSHTLGRLLRTSDPAEFPLKPGPIDLALLMTRACEYYRPSAARKSLSMSCQKIGDVPLAWADRAAVAVVADNLLSNAVKFSKRGGEIVVEVVADPDGVVCSVRDDGPGVSAEDQGRLFQKGIRLSATPTGDERSNGFGLAIARELVDRMGGRIWYAHDSGPGARFSFRLPRAS